LYYISSIFLLNEKANLETRTREPIIIFSQFIIHHFKDTDTPPLRGGAFAEPGNSQGKKGDSQKKPNHFSK